MHRSSFYITDRNSHKLRGYFKKYMIEFREDSSFTVVDGVLQQAGSQMGGVGPHSSPPVAVSWPISNWL